MYEYTFYFRRHRYLSAPSRSFCTAVTVVADDVQEARRALYHTNEHATYILECRKEADYVPRPVK